MDLIALDFETYYDKQYSLSKLTTEEYIRDDRFEVIGLSIKINNGPTQWVAGEEAAGDLLAATDFTNAAILCHNTMFDGAILSWHYQINPKMWLDTLCMGRALHGTEHSVALKSLAQRYGVGVKGTEVADAMGKRIEDFAADELEQYGRYCSNDVDLTVALFRLMAKKFPKKELQLIDLTLRMFIEPMLDLDEGLLEQHLEDTRDAKDKLLIAADVEKADLMSNQKFADLLRGLGVEPPTKISSTTGKEAFAFAKSDEAFKALHEHEDVRIQALVAARLGNKSTLEETRTQRFLDISRRGLLPVPVRYYAAHTGRWGGSDKINLQNLPSRGPNGKKLKRSIIAPEGYTLIDCDSSQIEARVLAWLAGQDDLTQAFASGDDVYKHMASTIYSVAVDDVSKEQRFVGKTTILGAGYGMGAAKFQMQLKGMGVEIPLDEAKRIIGIYRSANSDINGLWADAQGMIRNLANRHVMNFGKAGVIKVHPDKYALQLPSGLLMYYEDLKGEKEEDGNRIEYSYKTRRSRTRIYGGKVVENVCQGIARCIIGEQMLSIASKYKVVLTVHDSVVACVLDEEVDEAQAYIEKCMSKTPDWAEGLPVTCESGTGKSYGDCE